MPDLSTFAWTNFPVLGQYPVPVPVPVLLLRNPPLSALDSAFHTATMPQGEKGNSYPSDGARRHFAPIEEPAAVAADLAAFFASLTQAGT